MIYVVKPTPAKDLKSGDLFRAADDYNFKIKDIDRTDEVVEIEYYTGTRDYFVSFFVNPERIIDIIIDRDDPKMTRTLITICPTNGADLTPKSRIRLHGALHDVIDNRFLGAQPGENLWYELIIREIPTGKYQTIEYISGTIFDVVTDIREGD